MATDIPPAIDGYIECPRCEKTLFVIVTQPHPTNDGVNVNIVCRLHDKTRTALTPPTRCSRCDTILVRQGDPR